MMEVEEVEEVEGGLRVLEKSVSNVTSLAASRASLRHDAERRVHRVDPVTFGRVGMFNAGFEKKTADRV